jgi:hypothetical protein
MKHLRPIFTLTAAFLIILIPAGCTPIPGSAPGIQLPNPLQASEQCNADLDKLTAGIEGDSLIRQRIPNPCDAYRLASTAAKVGVIWDAYKVEQLVSWTTSVRDVVNAGITYRDFQVMVAAHIKGFNRKMGGTYLLLSELIVVFNYETVISPVDQAILDKGFDMLLAEARRLAVML